MDPMRASSIIAEMIFTAQVLTGMTTTMFKTAQLLGEGSINFVEAITRDLVVSLISLSLLYLYSLIHRTPDARHARRSESR